MRGTLGCVLGTLILAPCLAGGVRADGLPADAQKLVEAFDKDAADIQQRADRQIQEHRDRLVASLQALREKYAKAGQAADADALAARIDALRAAGAAAPAGAVQADPGNLTGFRNQVGKSFLFEVTGNKTAGSVWGSGVYTDDSILAATVVHAGVLADGQKGIVKVTILPGAQAYPASDRNGVSSGNWGAWDYSYRVQLVKK